MTPFIQDRDKHLKLVENQIYHSKLTSYNIHSFWFLHIRVLQCLWRSGIPFLSIQCCHLAQLFTHCSSQDQRHTRDVIETNDFKCSSLYSQAGWLTLWGHVVIRMYGNCCTVYASRICVPGVDIYSTVPCARWSEKCGQSQLQFFVWDSTVRLSSLWGLIYCLYISEVLWHLSISSYLRSMVNTFVCYMWCKSKLPYHTDEVPFYF